MKRYLIFLLLILFPYSVYAEMDFMYSRSVKTEKMSFSYETDENDIGGIMVGADGMALMEKSDIGHANRQFNYLHKDYPELRIYSPDETNKQEYMVIAHSGTEGRITNMYGSLLIFPSGNGRIYYNGHSGFAYAQVWWANSTYGQILYGLSDTGGNQLIFTSMGSSNDYRDHNIPPCIDPTIIMQGRDNVSGAGANHQMLMYFSSADNAGVIRTNSGTFTVKPYSGIFEIDGNTIQLDSLRSSNPARPADNSAVVWVSDGTGYGDDGDVMIAVNKDGVCHYGKLFDFDVDYDGVWNP